MNTSDHLKPWAPSRFTKLGAGRKIGRFIVLATLILFGFSFASQAARAGLYLYIAQSGFNVVVTCSGSLNITGLTPILKGVSSPGASITPTAGNLSFGPSAYSSSEYAFNGPIEFGSGSTTTAISGTGNPFAITGNAGYFIVVNNYESGTAISNSITFMDASFLSLGFDPGTYVYRFNSGANADTVTLSNVAPAPEPSTWVLLGVAAGLLAVTLRRRRV